MSDLRNQLDAARKEYAEIRYPDDLARDVRRRPADLWRVLLPLAPIGAVAAIVMLAISVWPTNPRVDVTSVAVTTPPAAIEPTIPESISMPTDFAPSVPASTFSVPSMPTIPSWSVSTNVSLETASTEEEPV